MNEVNTKEAGVSRPVYLQIGRAKSGNYWLYKILKNIQLEGGVDRDGFIRDHPIYPIAQEWPLSHEEQAEIDVLDVTNEGYVYRISSIFRMPVEDIDQYLSQTTHVWTHSGFVDRTEELLSKVDRAVYIVRDPRDVAVSLSRFMFTPYMQKFYPSNYSDPNKYLDEKFEDHLAGWADHVAGYMSHLQEYNVHLVFFERLLGDFDRELKGLLEYLDVDLDEEARSRIRERVSFSSMKADNPQHVRKGNWGGWVDRLTPSQQRLARKRLKPLLDLLGYPVHAEQIGNTLPSSPGSITRRKAKLIVQAARPPERRLLAFGQRLMQWKDGLLG